MSDKWPRWMTKDGHFDRLAVALPESERHVVGRSDGQGTPPAAGGHYGVRIARVTQPVATTSASPNGLGRPLDLLTEDSVAPWLRTEVDQQVIKF